MIFRRMLAALLAALILGGLGCSDNKSSQPPTATIPLQGPPKAGGVGGGGKGNQGPKAPAPGGGAAAH